MFERDGNPHAEGRLTGRALGGVDHSTADLETADGILQFDPETGILREIENGFYEEGTS